MPPIQCILRGAVASFGVLLVLVQLLVVLVIDMVVLSLEARRRGGLAVSGDGL